MAEITPEQLGEIIFAELAKNEWGMIDPYDFLPGSENGPDMQKVLQRVIEKLKASKD